MKALMMGLTPPLEGGSERHIYEISSRIKDSFVLTQKGSLCRNKIEGYTLKSPAILRNISFFISAFVYSVYLLFSKKRYNIIHIHENLLYFLIPILKIRYSVIVTVHGITGFKFYDNKFLWFFFRSSLKFADKIISVSVTDKALLDKEFDCVVYVPNGVDIKAYQKIKKQRIEKKITFVGRIHKQKGVEYLLKAFEIVSDRFSEYKLEIIGKKEGSLYESLSQKYVNPNIIWKGFILDREKIFSELACSEVLICPSLWEALPWPVLLECLGSGRPVIASNLAGMEQVFKDGKDILLVRPEDYERIAEKIIYLIQNKKTADKIGKAGKMMAKQYSWDSVSKKVVAVYKGIMEVFQHEE